MSPRTARWVTRRRWPIPRSSPRSIGAPRRRPPKRRPDLGLRTTLLQDPVERAEVQVRVAQLVEPVAKGIDVRLQPVDLARMVLVRLGLARDQLAALADLFRNGSLHRFPLIGQVAQLTIEGGQLAGQLLAGPAVAGD